MHLIRVKGNYNGITLESGKLLFKDMADAILNEEQFRVDFTNQEYITAVFINASFGKLYAFFKKEVIKEKMILGDMTEKQAFLVGRVLANAAIYWNDGKYKNAVDTVIAKMVEEMMDGKYKNEMDEAKAKVAKGMPDKRVFQNEVDKMATKIAKEITDGGALEDALEDPKFVDSLKKSIEDVKNGNITDTDKGEK